MTKQKPKTKALVKAEPRPPALSPTLALIERAARDKKIDIAKMRELLAMQSEEEKRIAARIFEAQMNEVQTKIEPVRKDADNPHTKSRFATYHALDAAIRPIYVEHGFSVSFDTEETDKPDTVVVLCYVGHRAGHNRVYRIAMPAEGKGAKGGDVMSKTHATGSAVTYGRRYLLSMILNIATLQDDDGNAAGRYRPAERRQETRPAGNGGEQPAPPPQEQAKPAEKQAPHAIERPAGISAAAWGGKVIEQVLLCETVPEVDAWTKANDQSLADLEKAAPAIYEKVKRTIDDRIKWITK
jgi:hypothetical protein